MINKPPYLFEIGEIVVFMIRSSSAGSRPAKIISRHREKDHFLSEANNKEIFYNVYITEQKIKGLRSKKTQTFQWADKELCLRSGNIVKPRGAVDYESDEYTADWLNKKGEILRTVKSGMTGLAHQIVSSSFHTARVPYKVVNG